MPLLVDVRKLTVINGLISDGASNVATAFGTLAGVETDVEVRNIAFLDPEDVPAEVGGTRTYVASVQLTEPPYGTFMLTFPPSTAREIASLMTGAEVDGDLSSLHRSALQEMCNVCTSAFIDGLANTLNTTIDMASPDLSVSSGAEIAREELSHVQTQSIAIVLDSLVDVPDRETDIELRIFLVPAPGSFVNLLDSIDIEPGTAN